MHSSQTRRIQSAIDPQFPNQAPNRCLYLGQVAFAFEGLLSHPCALHVLIQWFWVAAWCFDTCSVHLLSEGEPTAVMTLSLKHQTQGVFAKHFCNDGKYKLKNRISWTQKVLWAS